MVIYIWGILDVNYIKKNCFFCCGFKILKIFLFFRNIFENYLNVVYIYLEICILWKSWILEIKVLMD